MLESEQHDLVKIHIVPCALLLKMIFQHSKLNQYEQVWHTDHTIKNWQYILWNKLILYIFIICMKRELPWFIYWNAGINNKMFILKIKKNQRSQNS